jgi:hypothetical protein
MPLLKDVESVRSRLEQIKQKESGAEEIEELGRLSQQLEEFSQQLERLASDTRLLRDEGVSLDPVLSLPDEVTCVEDVKEKFLNKRSSQTLKQGRRWSGLINRLTSVVSKINGSRKNDWNKYFENNCFGGPNPDQRGQTLGATPQNQRALTMYGVYFRKLSKYKDSHPNSSEEFMEMRDSSNKLSEIEFQEDIPDSVRKFLEATKRGASLEFLTPEVIEWLRSNDSLDSYIVRART